MTGYGPDGVHSLHSRRFTRATDLSSTSLMSGAASRVTFPAATNCVISRMCIFRSRRFRVNSGGIHPACPDEGRERSLEGGLRPPRPSPISNRELDLLERDLSYCKQRAAAVSSRELWTVCDSPTQSAASMPGGMSFSLHGRRLAACGSRLLSPFLPGSAQNVECDVTHSKQRTATFLPVLELHITV
jgi:hypothetical protein